MQKKLEKSNSEKNKSRESVFHNFLQNFTLGKVLFKILVTSQAQ